ncbi:MAG: DUF2071 domain-containing protein [Verrucomicrobiota bacterium]
MKMPTIEGVIRRRILLNYRVDAAVVQGLLPEPFRPQLVGGFAIAGICLIRLEQVRPSGWLRWIGVSSENSAHRFAVEWEGVDGEQQDGVYIPRRDSGSWFNSLAGGRLFPGVHKSSRFDVEDRAGDIHLKVHCQEVAGTLVEIRASETQSFPEGSVFGSADEASRFFEKGCLGYSPSQDDCTLDGLLLEVKKWQVAPLQIDRAISAYFDDHLVFPEGSIELDHALLMRDIPHSWHAQPRIELGEAQ